ncbi:MAG: hypothetical protein IH793_06820 [Acidobacteria bacterium]|nr:hypothetical protein [Acidobacteriota bacterium]
MKTLHSVIAIGLVGCLLALPLVEAKALQEAQPPAEPGISDWNNLQQLRVGDKVEVVRTDLSKLKGTFLSFSDEAISLRIGKDEVGVQRPKVFRVSAREHSKRLRNTFIGLGIGAAAGAVVGVAAVAGKPRQAGERRLSMVIGTLIGAGAGTVVGAAFSPGYQTIYRAKGKRGGTQP